ncbi:MAG: histidine kinase [Syntrophus sp. (in: bacteria)]|nr:histidine kinase [Syntrophus sp. (in: bacteria)]
MDDIDIKALRRKVENLQTLPTIPSVLRQLMELMENPKTSLMQISKLISNDPVLATKILKMVNSPIYGFPGRISTVSQGVMLLGLNVVKGLLLGVSVFDLMQKSMIGLWEHSLGCAAAARTLAKKKGIKEFEEVSVAGLLHDFGKVILILQFPKEYETLINDVANKGISIYEAERDFFGVNHAEIGVWMTEKWSFPRNLVEIIGNHHRPGSSQYTRVETAIIHVSDVLMRARGLGFAGDPWVPAVNQTAWKLLDLSEADLQEVLKDMEVAVEASEGLFA